MGAVAHVHPVYDSRSFVERCADATLDEKVAAWREIVDIVDAMRPIYNFKAE